MAGFGGNVPLRILHCRSASLRRKVLEDLASAEYDAFHVDRFRLAPYALAAKEVFDPNRIVLDFPDALSLYYERAVRDSRRGFGKIVDQREHRVIPSYEAKVLSWSRRNVVCSEIDRKRLLEARPDASIEVIPNMVDVAEFVPRSRPQPHARAVFSGTLYYLPNIDGLLWLRDRILPLLVGAGLEIEVLGYGATRELEPAKADDRFHFRGYVENMADHLYQEDIYLCPLRIGAGIRFKLLEAFSAGMATVSTTLGYEGIPCQPGEHLLVADTEEEFAEAVRFLLENPAERQRLGAKARELVVEKYSVEATGKQLESLYNDCLKTSQKK